MPLSANSLTNWFPKRLGEWFSPRKRLWQQEQEIERLRKELSTLQNQNDSMRQGMRRCVSCEYRIDFKQRQSGASD